MRHKDFWLFRTGQLFSAFGDVCGFFGLSWWMLTTHGTVSAMSVVVGPALAVRLVLRPIFGVLGDRWSRKKLAVAGDLLSAAAWFAIFAYAWLGGTSLLFLSLLSCCSGAAGALFSAGSEAMIPMLVPREDLARAVRAWESTSVVLRIAGGGLGGLLVQAIGGPQTFLLNAITFMIAAFASAFIGANTCAAGESQTIVSSSDTFLRQLLQDLRGGFQFAVAAKVMFHTTLIMALVAFFVSPIDILLPKYISHLQGSAATLGMLISVRGVGSILGLWALPHLRKWFSNSQMVTGGMAVLGGCVVMLGLLPALATLGVSIFIVGFASILVNIPLMTQIDLVLPENQRSRFHSWMTLISGGCAPLGVMLAGSHEALWGEFGVYVALGTATIAVSLLTSVVPNFCAFMGLTPISARVFLKETYSLGDCTKHAATVAN
jgi:DHA3 family macrolide efflux protein-like MFS transporter